MTDSPGARIRSLIRSTDRAVLSTTLIDGGAPYGSLVMMGCDMGASPLLLISDLADHTKNLKVSPVCSLLVDGTAGLEEPLTGARATLVGTAEPIEDDGLKARYVRRHPSASFFAGFGDFHLYRMTVDKAHIVAGFGRIHWVEASSVIQDTAPATALAEAEEDVVDHMNEDHGDAVGLYANRLLGLPGVGWRLTGVDPEGADLRRGGEIARIAFDKPAHDAESARVELVRLVKRARQAA